MEELDNTVVGGLVQQAGHFRLKMFHLITDLVLLTKHLITLIVQSIVVDLEVSFNLRLVCYQPIINVHSLYQVSVLQLR